MLSVPEHNTEPGRLDQLVDFASMAGKVIRL